MSKFAFYCTCGGAMTGEVEPDANAEELERIFWSVHEGPRHQPSGPHAAAGARRDEEAV